MFWNIGGIVDPPAPTTMQFLLSNGRVRSFADASTTTFN
jgi:hypothetical protein